MKPLDIKAYVPQVHYKSPAIKRSNYSKTDTMKAMGPD